MMYLIWIWFAFDAYRVPPQVQQLKQHQRLLCWQQRYVFLYLLFLQLYIIFVVPSSDIFPINKFANYNCRPQPVLLLVLQVAVLPAPHVVIQVSSLIYTLFRTTISSCVYYLYHFHSIFFCHPSSFVVFGRFTKNLCRMYCHWSYRLQFFRPLMLWSK